MAWEWSLLELQLGDVVGSLVALLRVGILLVVETNGRNGKRNKANFGKLQTKRKQRTKQNTWKLPSFPENQPSSEGCCWQCYMVAVFFGRSNTKPRVTQWWQGMPFVASSNLSYFKRPNYMSSSMGANEQYTKRVGDY